MKNICLLDLNYTLVGNQADTRLLRPFARRMAAEEYRADLIEAIRDDYVIIVTARPDYQSMRALSYELGTRFVQPDTLIVDAGCSTGMAVEPFVERFKDTNDFLLIDNSPAMATASKERFSKYPGVEVRAGNLWENLPLKDTASLVLSVLPLQFMPTAYRQTMISAIYESLTPGGAFIFVEKIVSENMDDLMVELYYDMKRRNGYSEEQIMDKRRSLENVLSPLKPEWNVDMLRTAGFDKVDMFWRCLNFCGWIAVK